MRKLLVTAVAVVLIAVTWAVPALAQDQPQKEIKLDQAITMALQSSNSNQKAKLDVEKTEKQRDNASDNLVYTPVPDGSYNAGVEQAWYSLLSADMNWELSKKTQSAQEDVTVLDTCKKYWEVLKAQADLNSKELALTKAQLASRRIQAMVRLGMSPPEASTSGPEMAIAIAEKTEATAQMNLTASQNSLKSAYEALNNTIGLQSDERPVLSDQPKYEPLKVDSLDGEVARVLANSPSVWKAEQSAELAKYANDLAYSSGSYVDNDVREIQLAQANLDAISSKDAAELLTRGYYYQIKNLEDSIPAAKKTEKQAEEALRIAKISFDLGMITREDLQSSQAALSDAQAALLNAEVSHAYYVMVFQKPWAV